MGRTSGITHHNIMTSFVEKMMSLRLSAFLILCFILGGTSQDIVAPKLPLYLIALCLIGWSLTRITKENRVWKLKLPILLFTLFLSLTLIYLVPLPPSIWQYLPGRGVVKTGFDAIGAELPWLPISLTPEKTLFSLFDFLPPIAVALIIGVEATYKEIWFALLSIALLAIVSIIIGAAQISNTFESLYFYTITNDTVAVGFFSNANHQASFLLMVLPLCVAILLTAIKRRRGQYRVKSFPAAIGACACVLIPIGLILTQSLTGYLLLPLIGFGLLTLKPTKNKKRKFLLPALLALFIMALIFDFLFLGNHLSELTSEFTRTDHNSRRVMFSTTFEAIKDYFPVGSGLGSFSDVYRLYETPGSRYINHAHNDYLEFILELGLAGIIFIGLFLTWWIKLVWKTLSMARNDAIFAKAASLSALCILLHSLVDYPLRTISISTLFVFCLCLMVFPLKQFKQA